MTKAHVPGTIELPVSRLEFLEALAKTLELDVIQLKRKNEQLTRRIKRLEKE